MVDECRSRNQGAVVFEDDLKDLKLADKFDYVFSLSVLFFFSDEERPKVFENLQKIVKPEGLLHLRIREARYDKAQDPEWNDFGENDLRTTLQKYGFRVEKSIIGDRVTYGPAGQDNLDRHFNRLTMIAKNVGLEAIKLDDPSTSVSGIYSATRQAAIENAGRGRGGSLKL